MYYVLAYETEGKTLYWKNGTEGGLTEDLSEARSYARKASAELSVKRLRKRIDGQTSKLNIQTIKEKTD